LEREALLSAENIEVITLSRGTAEEDGNWVAGGGHRVYANWTDAECEVKSRVLRTLAARSKPPDGVAFVRGWTALGEPIARVPTFGIAREAAASCALDGDTQATPENYGPAAEMAAAARDAEIAAAPKGRKRVR
jgi:hypothetical protein